MADDNMAENVEEQWEGESLGDDVYYVERINKKAIINGEVVYNVKWLGYDESQNTWETVNNLHGSSLLLLKFENELRARLAGKTDAQKRVIMKDYIEGSWRFDTRQHEKFKERFANEEPRVNFEIVKVIAFNTETKSFTVMYSDDKFVELNNSLIPVSFVLLSKFISFL